MAKIFLDAGHGGKDPGAIGSKSKEKDNALNVIKKLGSYLKKLGHTVKYSRTTDKYLTLTERTNLANNWGADIFISAHNNAAASSATGFETFIYNGSVSANTKKLQNSIHSVIAKDIGISDRGKKRANFAVVRQTKMPAILIEYAFITNKKDESILINQVDKLARLTANGVAKYCGQNPIKEDKPVAKKESVHAAAMKKAAKKIGKDSKPIMDGTRISDPLTRGQLATVLDRLGLLD